MDKLRKIIREVFDFSEREANGFIVLSFILILILAFPWVYRWYMLRETGETGPGNPRLIFQVTGAHEQAKALYTADTLQPVLTHFDPNTASKSELRELGIASEYVNRIIKYREAGGKFYRREDLMKIYGFPDSVYKTLEPYIFIEKAIHPGIASRPESSPEKADTPFNLNLADTAELSSVWGIGKVLSARIIRFREKLGGFVRPEQVYEVYGLDSSVANKLIRSSFIPPDFVPIQIPVNTATGKDLAAHPYCSPKSASILVNYRTHHGNFTGIEDVKNSRAFTETELVRIAPYLSFGF